MHFEILVEDQSGKIALESILEKILNSNEQGHSYKIISYKGIGHIPKGLKGKTDPQKRILLDQLPRLLRGYGKSLQGLSAAVILVVDLDNKNCLEFKQELLNILNTCNPQPTALFPAIKMLVDADRRPGRFLLTGSADVQMLPKVSESLAGRMEIITLWPLSQGELLGRKEHFIDGLFLSEMPGLLEVESNDLTARVAKGGYPEAVQRAEGKRRDAWYSSYTTAILQRDIRDLENIEGLTALPRLLALLATRIGGLLNMSELSRATGIPHTTLKRYLALLTASFLMQPLPAWHTHLGKRLVKSPKVHLVDTGLAAHLIGHTRKALASNPTLFGHLLESFVVGELRKQATWSETRVGIYHYRTATGQEVDIVLENGAAGPLVGIEVKASATVTSKDFSGLRALAEVAGDRFKQGVVLYTGEQAVSFASNMVALPISVLWAL